MKAARSPLQSCVAADLAGALLDAGSSSPWGWLISQQLWHHTPWREALRRAEGAASPNRDGPTGHVSPPWAGMTQAGNGLLLQQVSAHPPTAHQEGPRTKWLRNGGDSSGLPAYHLPSSYWGFSSKRTKHNSIKANPKAFLKRNKTTASISFTLSFLYLYRHKNSSITAYTGSNATEKDWAKRQVIHGRSSFLAFFSFAPDSQWQKATCFGTLRLKLCTCTSSLSFICYFIDIRMALFQSHSL